MTQDVTKSRLHSTPKYHFFAGLTTGLLSASLLQPADLLKTRLQQPHRTAALLPTIRSIISGPNADGVRGLWRGTLPSVIRTGMGSALYFSSLNTVRTYFAPAKSPTDQHSGRNLGSSTLPRLSKRANLFSGALARATAGFVLMPVTVVKVRYESSLYAYRDMLGACKNIMKNEGTRGFFKGAGATAVRDAPYAGLYMVVYEEVKKALSGLGTGRHQHAQDIAARAQSHDLTGWQAGMVNFPAGVVAAAVATALTNPFDAVKTRLQLVPGSYYNMVDACRRMIKEEGWRSLMDGFGLRVGRKALSSALSWTVYEELIRRAQKTSGDPI